MRLASRTRFKLMGMGLDGMDDGDHILRSITEVEGLLILFHADADEITCRVGMLGGLSDEASTIQRIGDGCLW